MSVGCAAEHRQGAHGAEVLNSQALERPHHVRDSLTYYALLNLLTACRPGLTVFLLRCGAMPCAWLILAGWNRANVVQVEGALPFLLSAGFRE